MEGVAAPDGVDGIFGFAARFTGGGPIEVGRGLRDVLGDTL